MAASACRARKRPPTSARRSALVLTAALLAGCSGDPIEDWRSATERECRRAAERIAEVEPPATLDELAAAAPAAAGVAERAARTIERRAVPEDWRAKARPFLQALSELRKDLRRAGDAAARADAVQANRALAAAAGRLPALVRAAGRAGVPACGDAKRLTALLDAGRGPLLAHVFPRVAERRDRAVARAFGGIGGASSAREQATAVAAAHEAVDTAYRRLDAMSPPSWAKRVYDEYLDYLLDVNMAVESLADVARFSLIGAYSPADRRSGIRTFTRQLEQASRAERRAQRRLERLLQDRQLLDAPPGPGQPA